jgi:hypothetical protein
MGSESYRWLGAFCSTKTLLMKKLNRSTGFAPVILLIYGTVAILTIFAGILGYKEYQLKKANFVSDTPTPEVFIVSPSPEPTQTPKPVVINTIDLDPITDCVSSAPNCSGESIRLRQSQCYLITCCQVGNTWSVYPNAQKCKDAQSNVQTQNTTQNNVTNAKSNAYNICSNAVQLTFSLCQSTCNTNANTSRSKCSSLPLGDQFTACLNDVMNTFDACDDKCVSDSNQGIQKCQSVYN